MESVSKKLIVFDLDGTLVDSLPVLEFGINKMRRARGLSSLAPPVTSPRCPGGRCMDFCDVS